MSDKELENGARLGSLGTVSSGWGGPWNVRF